MSDLIPNSRPRRRSREFTFRVIEVDPPPDHAARVERALSILTQIVVRAVLERSGPQSHTAVADSAATPPPESP